MILDFYELLFLANSKQGASRFLILNKADIKLQILKTFIRLCFDIRIINQQQYLARTTSLQAIGKQLGGWILDETKKDR